MKKYTVTDRLENVEIKQAAFTAKTAACIYAIKAGYKGECKESDEENARLMVKMDDKVRYFDIDIMEDNAVNTGASTRNVLSNEQKRVVQRKKITAKKKSGIISKKERRLEKERIEKRFEKQLEKEKEKLEKEKKKLEVVVISAIIGCIIVCGPMISGEILIDTELLLRSMLNAFAEGVAATAIIVVIGLFSGFAVNFWAMRSNSKAMKYIKIAVIMIIIFVGISYIITEIPAYQIPE